MPQRTWHEVKGGLATWADGRALCEDTHSAKLCTLAEYCPAGQHVDPFGGARDGDMWAPYTDGDRSDWVQVRVRTFIVRSFLCGSESQSHALVSR